jgi:hypothetical protein
MDRLESIGVLFIGIGVLSGSIATVQEIPIAVVPSVFVIALGIATVLFRKYW